MDAVHGRGEWKGKPRRIFLPKADLRAPLNNPIRLGQLIMEAEAAVARGEKDPTQLIHKEHMMHVQAAIGEFCVEPRIKSIVIDGANKIHQSASFAEHGRIEKVMQRERGEMNRILTDIMQAPDLAGKHTIITAEAQSRWVDLPSRGRDGQTVTKSTETKFLKRGGWSGLGGTVRVEAMSMFCSDNDMVDRANFILEDHFDGFETSSRVFWTRIKKRFPRGVDSVKVGDFLLILQQSKDNVDLLIGEREWSVFVNKEINFPEIYRRVWDRELDDE